MSKGKATKTKKVAWTNNYTKPSVDFEYRTPYDNVKTGEKKFYRSKKEQKDDGNKNENELVFGVRGIRALKSVGSSENLPVGFGAKTTKWKPRSMGLRYAEKKLREKLQGNVKKAAKAFRSHDKNGNGTLSQSEFASLLSSLHLQFAQQDIDALAKKYDVDRNGNIDYVELQNGLLGNYQDHGSPKHMFRRLHHEKKKLPLRKPGLSYDSKGQPIDTGPQRRMGRERAEDALRQLVFANQAKLKIIFRQHDNDGTHKLSPFEFSEALRDFQVNLASADIDAIIQKYNPHGDGIDYNEFMRLLLGADLQFQAGALTQFGGVRSGETSVVEQKSVGEGNADLGVERFEEMIRKNVRKTTGVLLNRFIAEDTDEDFCLTGQQLRSACNTVHIKPTDADMHSFCQKYCNASGKIPIERLLLTVCGDQFQGGRQREVGWGIDNRTRRQPWPKMGVNRLHAVLRRLSGGTQLVQALAHADEDQDWLLPGAQLAHVLNKFGIFAQQSDMAALAARAASKKNSTHNRILVHIPSFVRTIAGDGRWQQEMDIIDAKRADLKRHTDISSAEQLPYLGIRRLSSMLRKKLREDQDGGAHLKQRMRELDHHGTGHLKPMLLRQALAAAYGILLHADDLDLLCRKYGREPSYDINIAYFVSYFGAALNPKERKRKMAAKKLKTKASNARNRSRSSVSNHVKRMQKLRSRRRAVPRASTGTSNGSQPSTTTKTIKVSKRAKLSKSQKLAKENRFASGEPPRLGIIKAEVLIRRILNGGFVSRHLRAHPLSARPDDKDAITFEPKSTVAYERESITAQPASYKLLDSFKRMNQNQDGMLAPEELADCLDNIGVHLHAVDIAKIVKQMNQDQDGRVSYNEFLAQYADPQMKKQAMRRLRRGQSSKFKRLEAARKATPATRGLQAVRLIVGNALLMIDEATLRRHLERHVTREDRTITARSLAHVLTTYCGCPTLSKFDVSFLIRHVNGTAKGGHVVPNDNEAERLNVDAFIEHFSTGKVRGFDRGVQPPLASCPLHGQWEDLKLRANGLAGGSRRTAPHRRDVEERLDTARRQRREREILKASKQRAPALGLQRAEEAIRAKCSLSKQSSRKAVQVLRRHSDRTNNRITKDRLGKALDELGIKLNDADLRALYSKFSGGKDHILTQKFLSYFNITPPNAVSMAFYKDHAAGVAEKSRRTAVMKRTVNDVAKVGLSKAEDILRQKISVNASRFRKIMRQHDTDRDGKLSAATLKKALHVFGVSLSDADVRAITRKYDVNKDGKISWTELESILVHGMSSNGVQFRSNRIY